MYLKNNMNHCTKMKTKLMYNQIYLINYFININLYFLNSKNVTTHIYSLIEMYNEKLMA